MNGTLKKEGSDVVEGQTLLNNGESLVWTPETDTFGDITAFSVRAFDGRELSSQDVDVSVYVSPIYNLDEYDFDIEAGSMSTIAIENTGKVWVWGGNPYAELGIGNTNDQNKPLLSEYLNDIKDLSVGNHGLAVQKDGTVWAWGNNNSGELGDGSYNDSLIPIPIDDIADVIDVEVGSQYSVALKNDGTVWTWGSNKDGRLGDDTADKRLIPDQVSGLTDIVAIAAGEYHTLALKNDGTVWAWGTNTVGTLGDNSNTHRYVPVKVSDLTDVVAIDAGEYNSYAIKADNTLWAWGDNTCGQLGNGTNIGGSLVPVQVDAIDDVADIDIDYCHVIARTNDGGLWTWGSNNYGQLGDGTNTSKYTPEQVSGVSNIVRISAGSYHSSAVSDDGTVFTWGNNKNGQLGNGTAFDMYRPITIGLALIKNLPEGEDNSIYIRKNSKHVFIESDFPYSHGDGNELEAILIESIEGNGTFQYFEETLEVNDEISMVDIRLAGLSFIHDSDEIGNNYASLTYKLYDGSDFSNESYTLTVNVAPFNNPPTSSNNTITMDQDTEYTFTLADFNYNDMDGDTFASVTMTSVDGYGTFMLNGSPLNTPSQVVAADISNGNLKFIPESGGSGSEYAIFEYSVNDGELDSVDVYSMTVDVSKSSEGSGSSGSGGSNNHSNTSQDEKSDDSGVAEEETSVVVETTGDDNKTVATVTFDEETLKHQLEDKDDGVIVSLPVDTEADTVIGELSGDLVKEMEDKEAVVELKTEDASYSLPAKEISINALAKQIGENVEAKDITIKIEISKSSDETVKFIENNAETGGFILVAPPIDFEVKFIYKDKEVKVDKFSGYVERTIALPDGIGPNKVTTGLVLNPDGSFRHVPTKIVMIDGKYYAKINSLTNSTYFVITSEVQFDDVENHWAKEYVNELGSRKIISGVDEENFLPDRDITRAEFTTIIVRALGLKTDGTTTEFKDVNDKDWFVGAVSAASEYNLVSGYDGNFYPNKAITRQEAMVIMTRAMMIANLETDIDEVQVEIILDGYFDSDLFSKWARKAAAICVDNGIIKGNDSRLEPTENITRAETATIIMRLLKTMGLV